MNKIPCTPQNSEAKTLPADVCIFGHFGQLLPAAIHSADCQFDSGVKWWIHVSSIVTYLCKNSFLLHWNSCKQFFELSMRCCLWLTVSLHSTHNEHSFLIDKCPCKMVNILPSDIYNFSTISNNFILWLAEMSLWSFLGQLLNLDNLSISIICVCTTAFKVSIPPLNHCFWWSRIQITLIKPLLCLSSIFPIRKQYLINTENSDFSIVLKIWNSSFT